jgi:dihydroneopterin aldolase
VASKKAGHAEEEEEEDESMARHVTIGLAGVELRGHCGVSDAERLVGQRIVVDVRLVPREAPGVDSDDLAGTVNYSEVTETVRATVEGREHHLIEHLAGVIADELFAAYRLSEVAVRVRKPAPPVSIPVDAAWAEVVRRA